jgi:hypothetical protein
LGKTDSKRLNICATAGENASNTVNKTRLISNKDREGVLANPFLKRFWFKYVDIIAFLLVCRSSVNLQANDDRIVKKNEENPTLNGCEVYPHLETYLDRGFALGFRQRASGFGTCCYQAWT